MAKKRRANGQSRDCSACTRELPGMFFTPLGAGFSSKCRICEWVSARRAEGLDVHFTVGNFTSLLLWQHNECAVCRTEFRLPSWWPEIDFNANTGRVRGLLCYSCCEGIRRFDGDPSRLLLAAGFVDSPPGERFYRGY